MKNSQFSTLSSPTHPFGWFQDLLNLLDYSLVIASWLDVATSASTYRERVQLASTIRVFRFVRIVRLLENSKSDLLVIARGRPSR